MMRRQVELGAGNYEMNVSENPLPLHVRIEHAGEYVARSVDGSRVLAYGSMASLKRRLRTDHGLTVDDVSVAVEVLPEYVC